MSETDELRGTETVLVVDDDEDARQAMCRTLEFHGYTTLQAGDGEEAIAVLEDASHDVALVVVDLVMPEMSGLSLGQALEERHPGARILFTSGYADQGVPDLGRQGERVDFVSKPMTIRELAAKVRELLDRGSG